MYSLRSESVMKNRRDVAENNQSSNEKKRGEENGKKPSIFNSTVFFLFSAKNQNKEMKMSDILSDIIQRAAKKYARINIITRKKMDERSYYG